MQASFNPPGLTISVKRDRAIESLLTPGRPFVVNVLAEGKDKALIKQLLRPFKPGEDRFSGIDTEVCAGCLPAGLPTACRQQLWAATTLATSRLWSADVSG